MSWDTQAWKMTLGRLGVKPKEVELWAAPFSKYVSPEAFTGGRAELVEFLTQIIHESAGVENRELRRLYAMEENLNYSVTALLSKFGRHRISEELAKKYGRIDGVQPANQRAIANTIYGGEWGKQNLGNTEPEDGWNMRGSGLLQTTGRSNFQYLKDKSGIDVIANPDLARKPGDPAVQFAIITWKRLVKPAIIGNEVEVRRAINGGTLGIEDCRTIRVLVNSVIA